MDLSKLGSRRKIVHVWDIFGNKTDSLKEKLEKENNVKKQMREKPKGVYVADGVTHGVKKNVEEHGRKKRPAPKPPNNAISSNQDVSIDPVTGIAEEHVPTSKAECKEKHFSSQEIDQIEQLDRTEQLTNRILGTLDKKVAGCKNFINKSLPEYDPVTGLKIGDSKMDSSSHGFILGQSFRYSTPHNDYHKDFDSSANNNDPYGLTASGASKVSTRASSGYYSDVEARDMLLERGSPNCPSLKEIDAEYVVDHDKACDDNDSDPFAEEEMTMSFDEEEEDLNRNQQKLYQEYAGEDFSVFMQDESNNNRKQKKKSRRRSKNSKSEISDPTNTKFKGTMLGITRNYGSKNVSTSFDKLSNFSYADSKIGSMRPDKKTNKKTGERHWWDVMSRSSQSECNEADILKLQNGKSWKTGTLPEHEFSVFNFDKTVTH